MAVSKLATLHDGARERYCLFKKIEKVNVIQ